MSNRITKSEFELAVLVLQKNLGQVVQWIAEDAIKNCKSREELPQQLVKISMWKEEDLKFKIWRACDSLEIFLPHLQPNEYWKAEEALDILWTDKSKTNVGFSGFLHGYDIRSMISTMATSLWYIQENIKKVGKLLR